MRKSSVEVGLLLAIVSMFSVAALSVVDSRNVKVPGASSDFDLPVQLGKHSFHTQNTKLGQNCAIPGIEKKVSLPEMLFNAFSWMIRFSK